MKCSEIMEKLEAIAPVCYAEEWDNVGFLAGRREKEVQTVFIALDATDAVIDEAIEVGADMILTHHPLIFKPLTRVNEDDFIGRRLIRLIQNDISYYAMHTNFDVMGMAEAASEEMGLLQPKVLMVTYENGQKAEGIGRYGKLKEVLSLSECAAYVKEVFRLEHVNVYGDLETSITVAAISPGSGKSVVKDAVAAGVDVLITGDVDHHMGIDLQAQGICVIDAGHYGIEKIFVPYMKDFLKKEIPSVQICMAEEKNPYCTL